MTTLFSLLIIAIGLTLVSSASRKPGTGRSEFPRHHEPVAPSRRYLLLLLGMAITLCGGGIFVISRLE